MRPRPRWRTFAAACDAAEVKHQVIANAQCRMVQEEDKQNIELLDLSREILTLTKEVRSLADPTGGGSSSRRA